MLLTGYHGTIRSNADKVISTNEFKASTTDKEWLGNGIYFFEHYEDALLWNRGSKDSYAEAIIHAIIKVDSSDYVDFDLADQKYLYGEVLKNLVASGFSLEGDISARTCLVMNLIWDSCANVKVLAASFPREEQVARTLLDYRTYRREFCVRNNDQIKSIIEVEKVI